MKTASKSFSLSHSLKARFAKLVINQKSFLIAGHHGPDGDVVGSTLALALALKKMKKKVYAYNADGCPPYLRFLPGAKIFVSEIPKSFKGVLITVDSGSFERLGEKIEKHKFAQIWNIDHHQSNTFFGDENFIDVAAGSTGQVVHDLLQGCPGFKLSEDIATCILCTLSTDTGSFKYRNATAEVFELASKLVRAGARPEAVSEPLYDTYPKVRLALMNKVLSSLKYEFDDRLALTHLTLNDLATAGASRDDADSFVNLARGVEGVKISCFIREVGDDKWTLSLRSRGNINVLPIAQSFGGGGHQQAAGCTVNGSFASVKSRLQDFLSEHYFQ